MQEYLSINDCNLAEFSKSLDRKLQQNEVPLSHDIKNNVPIYDVSKINFLTNICATSMIKCRIEK